MDDDVACKQCRSVPLSKTFSLDLGQSGFARHGTILIYVVSDFFTTQTVEIHYEKVNLDLYKENYTYFAVLRTIQLCIKQFLIV